MHKKMTMGLDITLCNSISVPAQSRSFKIDLSVRTDPSHGLYAYSSKFHL